MARSVFPGNKTNYTAAKWQKPHLCVQCRERTQAKHPMCRNCQQKAFSAKGKATMKKRSAAKKSK